MKIAKQHKIHVRNQSPHAEESFYDQDLKENTTEPEKKPIQEILLESKQPNIYTFSDDDNEKPKSKTDINFYDFSHSQKSIKVPSSRPPLSKKSNASSSKSKSKSKEGTLNIQMSKGNNSKKPISKEPTKKMTLIERAMMKNYDGSDAGSNSQESFGSR